MARTNRGTVKVFAGTDGIPTIEIGGGVPGVPGGTLPASTDGTMAANSDSLMPTQKAVVTYVGSKTLISGFTTGAAISDTDTIGINQGAGNLKQTFTAIKTWITNWLAGAVLTWTNKTLTAPAISSAAMSGTFTGNHTQTGNITFSGVSYSFGTVAGTILEIGRVDGSTSTNAIDFHTGATAVDYDTRIIATGGSGVSGGGTLNVQCATFQFNASSVMTRGASETITGVKTVSIGNATTAADYFFASPNDFGVGKPRFAITKSVIADTWTIGIHDGVNTAGTINVSAVNFTYNGSIVMTLGASETVTGTKTFSSATTVFANSAAAATILEIGKTTGGVAQSAVLDFHSSGNNNDYDARIIATGGTTPSNTADLTLSAATLNLIGDVIFSAQARFKSFTVATLPSAATYTRSGIYVSDGTSNKRFAISDGTNFRFPDGAIVS